jgi:hypothetical protein
MLKLTIPDVPDLYSPLSKHERVARVVALPASILEPRAANASPPITA